MFVFFLRRSKNHTHTHTHKHTHTHTHTHILYIYIYTVGDKKNAAPYSQKLGSGGETSRSPSCGKIFLLGFFDEKGTSMVTSLTGGSSVAFKTGWACYEAAMDIKRQLIERAAHIWDVDSSLVEYSDGVVSHTSDPELKFTFKEMAARLNATGGPITGRGNVSPTGVGGCFATHIVDVEVDPDTGKIDILRYTALQYVGKAVHPSYVEGQIQGGAVQGIG